MTKAKLSFGISKRWIVVALVVLLGVATITASLCSRVGFAADEPSTREIDGKTFYELGSEADLLWFANECDEKIEYTMESDSSGNRTMNGIIELNAILTADIDVSSGLWNSIGFYERVAYDEEGSVLKKVNFEGIFDGNGYTIHGMNIANTAAWGDGMFTLIGESGVVKNLHLEAFAEGEIGFGAIAYENRGVISNCHVTGELFGQNVVGGIVGYNGGLVENCTSEADVYALYTADTGGIAGRNYFLGTLKNCRNFGEVGHKAEFAGGIAGNNAGTIENCYNVGFVTGSKVGGIAAYNYGKITNSYFDSDVFEGEAVAESSSSSLLTNVEGKSATDFANGTVCNLLGYHSTHLFSCSNEAENCLICNQYVAEEHKNFKADYTWNEPYEGECYVYLDLYCGVCDSYVDSDSGYAQLVASTEAVDCLNPGSETYEITFNIGEQSYTASKTVSIKSENHVTGFENGFCSACGGYEKPQIDQGDDPEWDYDDVYLISNAGQLYWFADYVNNVNNNVSGKLVSNIIVNTTLDENARPWTPIGLFNSYRPYCGDFDGNGYTISGLYFKDAEASGVGLFGYTDYNYRVKNVGLENCYFEGKDYVGGLFGYASTEISNCFVGKDVTVIGEGDAGAFAGYLGSGGTVSNCFAYASTFVGNSYSDYAYIENCYYLSETETEDGGKTAEQFANGEVAFLLQAGVAGEDIYDDDWNVIDTIIPEIWGQEIGVDALPVLGGEKVYSVTDCKGNQMYSNSNEVVHVDLNEYGYCEACQVKITGASISIGSSLTMNYQAEILDSSIIEEGYNVAMQFTMNGNTVLVYPPMYGAETQATLSTYNFAFEGISPQNMASLIDAVLVLADGDGNVVKALASKAGYSVKENAEKLLEIYYYEDYLVQLVTDMLEYGAAAQEYRDFNTDNKANAGLEYLPSEKLPNAYENVKEIITAEGIEIGDVYFVSATVWFDNVNRIGVKLSTTENATLYVNGAKAELDGTVYYTGAIYATDFGRVFTFELYDGETLVQTLKYSVASYVYSMMNKTENGELTEMANLARSLYRYGFSANAYRHFSERTECEFGEVTGYEWSKDFSTCTAHGTCKYCNNEFSVTVNTALENGEFVAAFENSVAEIQKKPVSALSDLRGFTNEELQSAVTFLLENGVTDVDITVDADADMTYVSNAITSTDKTDIKLKVSGVTSIGEGAFANNTQISSVSFPDALEMDDEAFYYCSGLKKVDAPKLISLGNFSLLWCNSMEEINAPEVESIGTQCFFYCAALKSISFKKVTAVDTSAFYGCSGLEHVDMPELTQLSQGIFRKCKAITTVTFEKVTSVGAYAFESCSSLEIINIPNISSVGSYAFNGTAIKEISLPDITSIGIGAFSNCKKLEIVNIPKLIEIPDSAFDMCTALTEISFPEALSIGVRAFYRCSNLETVDIPKATSIGKNAFYECNALKEANFPLVTDVGNRAFYECGSLTKAYFPEALTIGERAFIFCRELAEVHFPKVTFVGESALEACYSITEIRLDSAVELDDYALYSCDNLTTLYLPKVTTIGYYALGSSSLTHVTFSAEGEITFDVDAFYNCDTKGITLVLNQNKEKDVVVNTDGTATWNGFTFKTVEYN